MSPQPNVATTKPVQIESTTTAEKNRVVHDQIDAPSTEQAAHVDDKPQSSVSEKASENEPREDPLGEESRPEVVEETQQEVVQEKKDGGQQQVNQQEEEAKKDEGEQGGSGEESAAPQDEEEIQQHAESEVNAETATGEVPPAENNSGDKPDVAQVEEQDGAVKTEAQDPTEGETEATKEAEEMTAQVDGGTPTQAENAGEAPTVDEQTQQPQPDPAAEESKPAEEESQPAAEEAKPEEQEAQPAAEEADVATEEAKPAVEESNPAAEESNPAGGEPKADEQPSAEELQKSEDATPQEETPASEES